MLVYAKNCIFVHMTDQILQVTALPPSESHGLHWPLKVQVPLLFVGDSKMCLVTFLIFCGRGLHCENCPKSTT